jgi:hypothetical protein
LFVCEWRAETTEIKHRQFEVKRKEKPIKETTREKEPQQTPLLTSYASPDGGERIPIEIVHMWELNPQSGGDVTRKTPLLFLIIVELQQHILNRVELPF